MNLSARALSWVRKESRHTESFCAPCFKSPIQFRMIEAVELTGVIGKQRHGHLLEHSLLHCRRILLHWRWPLRQAISTLPVLKSENA